MIQEQLSREKYAIITLCGSVFSVIVCLFTIWLLLYFNKTGQFWRLFFALTIMNSLESLTLIWGAVRHLTNASTGCKVQAFALVFFDMSSSTYLFCMSLNIYRMINDAPEWSFKYEMFSHCFSIVFALGLATLPLFEIGISYAESDLWCWLYADPSGLKYLLSFGYDGMLAIVILCLRMISWWQFAEKRQELGDYLESEWEVPQTRLFRQLFWIPISFIIIWCIEFLNRLVETLYQPVSPLEFIEASIAPLSSGVISILGIFSSNLFADLKEWIRSTRYHTFE